MGDRAQVAARRIAVARRLLDRGVPAHTLEALLPGWEQEISLARASAVAEPPAVG